MLGNQSRYATGGLVAPEPVEGPDIGGAIRVGTTALGGVIGGLVTLGNPAGVAAGMTLGGAVGGALTSPETAAQQAPAAISAGKELSALYSASEPFSLGGM